MASDVQSNPGPVNPDKIVMGSFHQGDSRFGESAGSQCMCNALWAICYSSIASVRYWTEWDLDRILTLGNDLYVSLGYTSQYLALDDLPNSIATENGNIQIEKSDSYLFELSRNSTSFLRAQEYVCQMSITIVVDDLFYYYYYY